MDETEAAVRLAVDAAERMAGVQSKASSSPMSAAPWLDLLSRDRADRRRGRRRQRPASCARGDQPAHGQPDAPCCTAFPPASRSTAPPASAIPRHDGRKARRRPACRLSRRRRPAQLLLAIERCHLNVEAVVATPYASGLAVLVDDEAVLGATVLDLGGGSVGMGVFRDGKLRTPTPWRSAASTSPWISRAASTPAVGRRKAEDPARQRHFLAVRRSRNPLCATGRRRRRESRPGDKAQLARIIRHGSRKFSNWRATV